MIELIKKDAIDKLNHLFYTKESVKVWLAPNEIFDVLKYNFKIENTEFLESTGWQWDYWANFVHEDTKYLIWGDGYYDSHANIEVDK